MKSCLYLILTTLPTILPSLMAFDLLASSLMALDLLSVFPSTAHHFALLALLFALSVLCYFLLSTRFSSSQAPPGSLGLPILGENLSLFNSFNKPLGIYEFLIPRYKKYGNIFKTNILGSVTVFVAGKETGKFIFTNEDKLFNLSTTKSMREVIGEGSLFEARGELHKKLRQIMGQPLSMESLKRHLKGMEDVALNILDGWKDRQSVCALDETTNYAFQIISYILFSSTPGPEQDQFKEYFHKISYALVALALNIPGFAYHEGLKARRNMDKMLDKIIARRRNGSEYKDDFLQSLLDKETCGGNLSDSELKDNLVALLFAGHETSASGLMWAMKFIEENPSVEKSLIMEHMAIRSQKNSNPYLTWEEINNMPYTNKFINETLRTANIARLLPRVVHQDTTIAGYLIRKGWTVTIDTQAPHLDATNFVEPHCFNPSRFDELAKPYTFMPFGGGPRTCLGMNLARVEMSVFLHHLITKYRWKSLDKNSTLAPTLIPKLKNGYPIDIKSCA